MLNHPRNKNLQKQKNILAIKVLLFLFFWNSAWLELYRPQEAMVRQHLPLLTFTRKPYGLNIGVLRFESVPMMVLNIPLHPEAGSQIFLYGKY